MRLVATTQFLRAVSELPKKRIRDVVEALHLLIDDPLNSGIIRGQMPGASAGIESIQAGADCRLLISGREDAKLLFVGTASAALQFARRPPVDATAYAEAPIAFQLRPDFWQTDPMPASESPSSGAPLNPDDLEPLILRAHRYLPLTQLLLSRGPEAGRIRMSLREIETAMAAPLPKTAHLRSVWWANDRSRIQALAWLAIGWRTVATELEHATITFQRDRQRPVPLPK